MANGERYTRQGVRDLNAPGSRNKARNESNLEQLYGCQHKRLVVLGNRAHRCVSCGKVLTAADLLLSDV